MIALSIWKQFIYVILHHVRERVRFRQVGFVQVPLEDNVADVFTEPLAADVFPSYRQALEVRPRSRRELLDVHWSLMFACCIVVSQLRSIWACFWGVVLKYVYACVYAHVYACMACIS
jgi:hypothetical protein